MTKASLYKCVNNRFSWDFELLFGKFFYNFSSKCFKRYRNVCRAYRLCHIGITLEYTISSWRRRERPRPRIWMLSRRRNILNSELKSRDNTDIQPTFPNSQLNLSYCNCIIKFHFGGCVDWVNSTFPALTCIITSCSYSDTPTVEQIFHRCIRLMQDIFYIGYVHRRVKISWHDWEREIKGYTFNMGFFLPLPEPLPFVSGNFYPSVSNLSY